jgi:hypothetical protein
MDPEGERKMRWARPDSGRQADCCHPRGNVASPANIRKVRAVLLIRLQIST